MYTNRAPIEKREHEDMAEAMLRTVGEVAEILITDGAPLLRQEVGSGHIHRIITSIGAPWEKAEVRVQSLTKTKPFTITHALLSELSQKDTPIPEGYSVHDKMVIATLLNGYDVPNPFGKKALRADLIVLTSLLHKEIAVKIERLLRKNYHTHALTLTAFAPIVYSVFRDLFAHEKDFLVVQVAATAVDIAFMKRGLLVDTLTCEHGIEELISTVHSKVHSSKTEGIIIDPARNAQYSSAVSDAEKKWLHGIHETLEALAEHHPLPRTVFLIAEPDVRDYVANLLNGSETKSLWLTDEPLRIVPIASSHLAPFVKVRAEAQGDVYLQLLALLAKRKHSSV